MKKFYASVVLVGLVCMVVACHTQTESISPGAATITPQMVNSLSGSKILIFTKTSGSYAAPTEEGIKTFESLAAKEKFTVLSSQDVTIFNDTELKQFNAIVFLNVSRDLLNTDQELAIQRYIQAGGGFIGIGAAAEVDRKGDWFWYRNLVGALVNSEIDKDKSLQQVTLRSIQSEEPLLVNISHEISVINKINSYGDFYQNLKILQEVVDPIDKAFSENSPSPATWMHDYDGGRSFYTSLGYSVESFQNKESQQLIVNALKYVVAKNYHLDSLPQLNYKFVRPESNRFAKKILVSNLDEPVKFTFFPDGDALIALRPGKLVRFDYKTNQMLEAGAVDTAFLTSYEFGLIGIAIDPEFPIKPYIYTVYSVQDEKSQVYQQLVRFDWKDNHIDSSTKKIILQYAVDQNCCHTGGDLKFSRNRELFFSTGDNTALREENGYSPMNFKEGSFQNDALRSAGNTQDLRGKILRIRINDDGSYTIPDGNLFTNSKEGRPEIYVMGVRNPYSMAWDSKTGNLFFGDVGPDANLNSNEKGSLGYDEINRVTRAGNFGWPLVIGQNQPYRYYDYVGQKVGDWVDPNSPKNISPHNTGAVNLPPANPSWIEYPYAISEKFPELGSGGRVALVADVYHSENYPKNFRYPNYYDNKLFILDFVRGWVKVVSFNSASGDIDKIEPFAPQIKYSSPIAAHFAPDGSLYLLEYGLSIGTHNPDARLVRIEYIGEGNRAPIAKININKTQVAVDDELMVDANNSKDPDGDRITFEWSLICLDRQCPEKKLGNQIQQLLKMTEPGSYQVRLTVTDSQGLSAQDQVTVDIGNEPPQIAMIAKQNSQFYWPDTKTFRYQINIKDKEDGEVSMNKSRDNPLIAFEALSMDGMNDRSQSDLITTGKELVDANHCLACHDLNVKKIGPAYKSVASKYKNNSNAVNYLINKIGNGGNGVWGDANMPAFSALSEASRLALATYVLSLNQEKVKSLPLMGEVSLRKFDEKNTIDYQLSAQYTDKAQGSIPSITVKKIFELKSAKQTLANYLQDSDLHPSLERARFNNQNLVKFEAIAEPVGFYMGEIDLRQIKSILLKGFSASDTSSWIFELHENSAQGPLVAVGKAEAKNQTLLEIRADMLRPRNETVSLYVSVRSAEKYHGYLFVGNVEFEK